MKRFFILIFFLGIIGEIFAFNCPVTSADKLPAYYESVDGRRGKDLLDAIQRVAKLGYRTDDFRYDSVWLAFKYTDLRPDGLIWEIYSTCEFEYEKDRTSNTSQTGECKGYNREHVMCQSWFGTASLAGKEMSSSKKNSPGSDIFHIYPASYGMNSRRGNRPYGEVLNATYTSANGTKYGTAVTTMSVANSVAGPYVEGKMTLSTNVLEPADEYKGDIARSYFGTMVKWAGEWAFNKNEYGKVIFDATIDADTHYGPENNYGFADYGLALMLSWHRQDPVSQKEVDRNNGIQLTQGNRNPFIDYPYLVEYIWGERSGDVLDLELLLCSADERFQLDFSNGFLGEDIDVEVDTVFWMIGEMKYDSSLVSHGGRLRYLPKTPVSCSIDIPVFMGWTDTPIEDTSADAPAVLYTQVTDFPSVSKSICYYAVFAEAVQTGATGQTIALNKTDSASWSLKNLKQTNNQTNGAYWLLVKDATITSPTIDLQALDSVAFTIRSYQSKKNISIMVDGVDVGQVSAAANTMQRYVWSTPELTGNTALTFISKDATASYGPGISEISLYLGGQKASYTNYLTHCVPISDLDLPSASNDSKAYSKLISDGHLLIVHEGKIYTAQGTILNNTTHY